MHVRAVLTGTPQQTPAKAGLTGHFKTPQKAATITADGVAGDHIMDRDNHGGVDQAVYLFGQTDLEWWSVTLDRPLQPGFFGENLLISDLESAKLCVGDQFQIGETLLEVTAPRIPCATYAAHVGSPQAIKQFYRAARPGAYARVLHAGTITPEMPVRLIPFSGIRIPITDMMSNYLDHYADQDFLRRVLHTRAHHKLHQLARTRLGKP